MLLAELEIRHSRAVVPTRRVALGLHWLPVDPPPGPGAGSTGNHCTPRATRRVGTTARECRISSSARSMHER